MSQLLCLTKSCKLLGRYCCCSAVRNRLSNGGGGGGNTQQYIGIHNKQYYHNLSKPLSDNSKSLLLSDTVVQNCTDNRITQPMSFSVFRNQPALDVPAGIFRGTVDRFNGITVESKEEYEGNDDFTDKLQRSIDYWLKIQRRAIWFKIQTEHAEWVPQLVKCDFEFHHAQNGYVMMYRWLPTDESANIPVYANTMIGVGGLVVNENNEVLVVNERNALIHNSWKLPGGFVEPNENLINAVIREVREETGIDSEFRTVVSVRHSHRGTFGCSDLYVVIALTPLNYNLQRCEREIAKIQWMPVHEYLEHPNVHETNRHFMKTLLDYEKLGIQFTCEIGKHHVLKKEYCLYFMQALNNSQSIDNIEKHQ